MASWGLKCYERIKRFKSDEDNFKSEWLKNILVSVTQNNVNETDV